MSKTISNNVKIQLKAPRYLIENILEKFKRNTSILGYVDYRDKSSP